MIRVWSTASNFVPIYVIGVLLLEKILPRHIYHFSGLLLQSIQPFQSRYDLEVLETTNFLLLTLVFTVPYIVPPCETGGKLFSEGRNIFALKLSGSNLLLAGGSLVTQPPPISEFYNPRGTVTSVPLRTELQNGRHGTATS
jgi:hypothetical protein